jgi:hypothetical protein
MVGLSIEENRKIKEERQGKNKKRCMTNQCHLEERFFPTLEECGGDAMDLLCLTAPADHDNKKTCNCSFCDMVGGLKNSTKKHLLDCCLVLVEHKWHKLSPAQERGHDFEPAAFVKMIAQLFLVFKRHSVFDE